LLRSRQRVRKGLEARYVALASRLLIGTGKRLVWSLPCRLTSLTAAPFL